MRSLFLRVSLLSVGLAFCFSGWSFAQTPATDSPAKTESDKGSPAKAKSDKEKKGPKFVRLDKEKKKPRALQTAIASYEAKDGPYRGAIVDLVGAVHIAEPEYYAELNVRFDSYDAVLFELVADPEQRLPTKEDSKSITNPIAALQFGMKEMLDLEFQLDGIDYHKKNFVHADMTPAEMLKSMDERGDGLMTLMLRSMGAGLAQQATGETAGNDLAMFSALFSSNRPLQMKRAFAKNMESMETQMAALSGKDGKSTLITERNNKALAVLRKELESGKKHIAIFYGAAHLEDMHEKLIEDFKLEATEVQWLDAWNLK